MKRIALIFSLSLAALLAGCSGRDAASYVDAYEEAMLRLPGSAVENPDVAARFSALYADLKGPDLAARIDDVYAEELFFGDTLRIFDNRTDLRSYLMLTAERVDQIEVDIKHVLVDGNDVWLNWRMKTRARAMGKNMRAETIGMSHLRFDEHGKVVLHQDYWDSSEGILIHIPVMGGLVRWTRGLL